MFVYLSKKIAIPNNVKLRSLSWNKQFGYIACGGDDGLLKVLKLEAQPDGNAKGLAAPSNLSMNQSLDGHGGPVQAITWNEGHQKMTTSDANGLIIVWMLYKSSWYEEMIKNSKSSVADMKWTSDGQKICIVYQDGTVIVGSVDGNRIWGKELKHPLTAIEWSPDSKMLIFGMDNGELLLYDNSGNFVSRLTVFCLDGASDRSKLVGIKWFAGNQKYNQVNTPALAIGYSNGRTQLCLHEADDSPVIIDTGIKLTCLNWNHDGSMIAFAGMQSLGGDKDVNVVLFYTPQGDHLRTLKVPGKEITACSWEGGSLRIALAVDSFIYFANIRPSYKWGYCGNTVVYSFLKPDKSEFCVIFWDTKNNLKYVKYMKNLVSIVACNEFCCLTTKTEDADNQFVMVLCNTIGTPLDSRYIDMEPVFITMTQSHIICANDNAFYTWNFKDPRKLATMEMSEKRKAGAEKVFHVEENPAESTEMADFSKASKAAKDPICAIAASQKILIIGTHDGYLIQYALPAITLVTKHQIHTQPFKLAINCNSSRIAIIDHGGNLLLFDLEKTWTDDSGHEIKGTQLKFDRKDVWDMVFAIDNPDMFAFMEKTRMFVMNGMDVEEPVSSSAYLCQFKDLEIKGVLLDEILKDTPHSPGPENLLDLEVKALRDMRDFAEKSGIEQSLKFVEEHPHPRLWRLLAESALERQNLQVAEQAYVKCKDYCGIQFIKRLQNVKNEMIRRAEIATYFGKFDDAEDIYLKLDRKDLAVELRRTIGDWFRLVQLVKSGSDAGGDAILEEAWGALGDYYNDRQEWQQAAQYYQQSQNHEKLAECYYLLEDFSSLQSLSESLPDNHKLLPLLGTRFASVGMCEQAVSAFVKSGLIKDAVNTCVLFNQWTTAIELAKVHNLTDIDTLLKKYAGHLLEKNKLVNAIELYRKAGYYLEAAKLTHKLARDEVAKGSSPMKIKKMFVLVGLLVEQYHDQSKTQAKSKIKARKAGGVEASSALAGLLDEDTVNISDSRLLDGPWRGAEAYHFYLLAQRQLYTGYSNAAMNTALVLRDYEDILPSRNIYCLIALCACANRAFGTCSKAFIKLETLEGISDSERLEFEDLATDIFNRYSPKDQRTSKQSEIEELMETGEGKIPICVVTGQAIPDYQFWMCPVCKHSAAENEISRLKHCPLCHSYM